MPFNNDTNLHFDCKYYYDEVLLVPVLSSGVVYHSRDIGTDIQPDRSGKYLQQVSLHHPDNRTLSRIITNEYFIFCLTFKHLKEE